MKFFLSGLVLLAPFLAGAAPPVASTNKQTETYMRVSSAGTNSVALQIAIRKMVPANNKSGPPVWLVGASHIGDAAYYKALQEHLDKQALVLYEGIGGGHEHGKEQRSLRKAPPDTNAPAAAEVSSLQSTLAESLGLKFQSDAIDYSKRSYRNSDLGIEELQQLLAQSGSNSESSQEFNKLLQLMDGSSMVSYMVTMLLKVVGSNPKLQGLTRLALIETLGKVQGDLSQMQGLPDSMKQLVEILIQKRNEKVIKDLGRELKRNRKPASIAIFYGAGHMDDMQSRLQKELRYEPGEVRWLTAFEVDTGKMGITQAEVDTIRSFIKWQMEALQKPPD